MLKNQSVAAKRHTREDATPFSGRRRAGDEVYTYGNDAISNHQHAQRSSKT
jgi:hypothetical protein